MADPKEQSQSLDSLIADAVRENYSMKEIADHLASSDNPEHQAWAARWNAANAPQQPASAEQQVEQVNAPLTSFVTQHPVEAAAIGAGALGALKAPGWYLQAQDIKNQRQKLALEERRIGAYEQQVAHQGMGGGQAVSAEVPQAAAQELSPLEQARIETERARAEAIKQKIALAEAKAARDEAAAKAKAEATSAQEAAKQRQQTVGATATTGELSMVGASEKAKIEKAIDADQRAQAAKAAVPQVAAQAPVAPPTVQLTPTPEVVAEGVPTVEKQTVKGSVAPTKTIPEGQVFKEGLGSGDNWLYNTYGAEGRKAILNQFNEGKPAGSYEGALALSKKAQEAKPGPQIPREVARERGIAPPETNYGKLGKTAKVAGAAGLLMTAAQAANAAQEAKKGNTAVGNEFLFNLLGAIPGLSTAFNAATYTKGLGEGEQQELSKRRGMAPTIR